MINESDYGNGIVPLVFDNSPKEKSSGFRLVVVEAKNLNRFGQYMCSGNSSIKNFLTFLGSNMMVATSPRPVSYSNDNVW